MCFQNMKWTKGYLFSLTLNILEIMKWKQKTKQKYWWHEWHLKIKTEHANKINYNYVLNNKNIS